jgi:anion-transporting  ArsA/GET3 family ATPase
LTEESLEKYLKKLIGRTDMEDALKKLDTLTNEEARMATAQVLKATHTVDDRVRGVEDKVLDVDDKVTVVIDGTQPSSINHEENMFNSDALRGKRSKSRHTTDSK